MLVLSMLSACQMTSAHLDAPAVLTNPGAEVRQELVRIISRQTGLAAVAVSEADFTQASELVVERAHQTDNRGELIQGRDVEMPHRFLLLARDGQCWLRHRNTGQISLLTKARCRVK